MPMPKYLNQMGLSFFIRDYDYFAQKPNRTDAIAYLVSNNFCNESGASYRVSAAKRIFDSPPLLQETLEYIAYKSRKASILEKQKAKTLLDNTQW